ncbi:MAG: hypothetical protein CVV27_00325 [Candidatus Melainabacteria bacterium HGW-Melainabacteria-1]|nr:MAG: hypothetical protein CVV27_00325 [Candidatus Melainabacteria bacterium HGW-Melainabacteria-1]
MIYLLYLILIASLVCLTLFQTSRSIYVRSLGLFMILGVALIHQFQHDLPNLGLIVVMGLMLVLGFASDYYAASLRTWNFRVSDQAIWGLVIGGFVGIFMMVLFPTMLPFLLGSLLGAMIGEGRARGFRSASQLTKATLGAFAGVFGMSTKLLLGIEMIYWFLNFSGPAQPAPTLERVPARPEAAHEMPVRPGNEVPAPLTDSGF